MALRLRSITASELQELLVADLRRFPANDCIDRARAITEAAGARGAALFDDFGIVAIVMGRPLPMRIDRVTLYRTQPWEISALKLFDSTIRNKGIGRFLLNQLTFDIMFGESSPNHRLSISVEATIADEVEELALRSGFQKPADGQLEFDQANSRAVARSLRAAHFSGAVVVAGRDGSIEIDVSKYRCYSSVRLPLLEHFAGIPESVSA